MTEADFQEQVTELARLLGWRTCHTRRAIGKGQRWTTPTSVRGWPDLVLWDVREGTGVLFRELKTEHGTVSPEQQDVLDSLTAAGCDAAVWRPSDWPAIQARLQRAQPRTSG